MTKTAILSLLGAWCAGCGDDTTGTPDLAAGADLARPPDLAMPDLAPTCATLPDGTACGSGMHCGGGACQTDTVLLLAGPANAGTGQAIGTSYQAGAWSAVTQLGSNIFSAGGGGVAITDDGRGVAVLRRNSGSALESASWSGSWGMLAAQATYDSYLSLPVAAGGGVMLVHQSGQGASTNYFARWQGGTTPWSPLAESTGTLGDNRTLPTVVVTAAGDPLVLFSDSSTQSYSWTLRTGGTWSASATIPGASEPNNLSPSAAIAVARGIGQAAIVAILRTGDGSSAQYATFSAGAWSTAASLVSDLDNAPATVPFALTALPDGRVAMAYVTRAGAVKVGFFDGSAWGAFTAVPAVTAYTGALPLSLARGAYGSAVVELAYLDTALHVEHTRLTDESRWTWSTPVVVDGSQQYVLVSIAVGP
jgi:hypothetical protein